MVYALLTGALGFVGYFAFVLVALRALRRSSPAVIATASSIVVYIVMLAAVAAGGRPVLFWPVSATYWFLALSFLMVFGAIYKSVSLRILLYLLNQPSRADHYAMILARYVETESYQDRLHILIEGGLATRGATGFQLSPMGRRIAFTILAVQTLYRIEHSC